MMLSTTVVFAKVPVMGQVKTRIGLTHGTELAFNIYNELLGVTAEALARLNHHIAFAGTDDPGRMQSVFPNAESFFKQSGKNLGERLHDAFLHLFDKGYAGICAVGCDCPSLSAHDVSQSFILLEKNDVVVGPAQDGGYYLIACKPGALPVFKASGWSTPGLLEETIAICKRNNFSHVLLDEKSDVDTHEDYVKWKMNV